MKKKIISITFLLMTSFSNYYLSQADLAAPVVGHIGVPGYYLGWNAGTGFPLQIRHNGAQPINFFTTNIQRMTITPTGLVGIGLNPTNTLLHLQSNTTSQGRLFRTDGLTTDLNNWQLFTGGAEKFNLSVPANLNAVRLNASQTNGGTMELQTGSVTRMFIQQEDPVNAFGVNTAGYIGIGTNVPASPWHIVGRGNANINNWQRALTIQGGSLYFTNAAMTGQGFMMAYPSGVPAGNFFASSVSDLTAGGTEEYCYEAFPRFTLYLQSS